MLKLYNNEYASGPIIFFFEKITAIWCYFVTKVSQKHTKKQKNSLFDRFFDNLALVFVEIKVEVQVRTSIDLKTGIIV